MPAGLSQRLLTLLQLTRMALVFTAISNALAGLLLRSVAPIPTPELLDGPHVAWLILVAVGLYGFGMSLNDIIDRRRDSQFAPGRPLPSGRIGVVSAHVVCVSLASLALLAGWRFSLLSPGGPRTLAVVAWCVALIIFYDVAGKYLVAAGLLTLGLIRFFNAAAPQPSLGVVWHPLLLLDHVTILSTICYAWEQKRPALNRRHGILLATGIVMVNAAVIVPLWVRRGDGSWSLHDFVRALNVRPALWIPAVAVVAFAILAPFVRRRSPDARAAGQTLMLYGLLWLILYDAAFVAAYVSLRAAGLVLLLLPVSYLSVLLMRTWSRLMYLSQRPQYQRAR
jgi:4-hydroxybenzoate polyprenyltransferase